MKMNYLFRVPLLFALVISVSPALAPGDVVEYIIEIVKSLSLQERSGVPPNISVPVDPTYFTGLTHNVSIGIRDGDYQYFTFPNSILSGISNFSPQDMNVAMNYSESHHYYIITVNYNSIATGPTNFASTYSLSGVYNGTYFEGVEGELLVSVDGVQRIVQHELIYTGYEYFIYSVPASQAMLSHPLIAMDNVPDLMKDLIQTRNAEFATEIYTFFKGYVDYIETQFIVYMANNNITAI